MMITVPKENIHFAFDPAAEPRVYANSGDTIQFCCQDCYCEQIMTDNFDFGNMDMKQNNPATGPLYIREAEPGDILRIRICSIDLADTGSMCVRTGVGVYEILGCHCRRFRVENNEVVFYNDIHIPVRPMIGVIGTAPHDSSISTQTPGEHGGNMDIRDLGEGTTLYLPVNVQGALLSMGDLHAVQGDGETVICGMEMSGTVTVTVDVIKNRQDIPTPFLVTASHYITTASDPSLDVCSIEAARKMHRFLQAHSPLTDSQTGMLLSLTGNLRISQMVNPSKGCLMEFPIGLAGEHFER